MSVTNTTPEPAAAGEPETGHAMAHVVSVKLLVAVFASLILLTAATVTVSEMNLGNLSLYVAMAVAATKGILVVLFFMHLLWDRGFNLIVFFACLVFAGLFISLALTDTKQYQPSVNPGEASGMQSVHKPFGTGGGGGGK